MTLDLESEPIGRTGGIVGSGARKVLGAPKIEPLEVVIREAVQNSWDAAEGEKPSIRFGVLGYELQGKQKAALVDALRKGADATDRIITLPSDEPLDALLLWDRGTSGLGGSMRPDENDDGPRDFIRFVYNIGDTKVQTETHAKGGTYGFGRSSFITVSRVNTILVHTTCMSGSRRQSRFIGMTWTDPERQGRRRLTGRHWWGESDKEGHVTPLLDGPASALARSLGMSPLNDAALGTSILILAPRWSAMEDIPSADPAPARDRALSQIINELVWHSWPRLLDRSISVSVRWFGEDVAIPHPSSHPRLRLFTRAYENLSSPAVPRGIRRVPISCERPRKDLGTLALSQAPFLPAAAVAADNEMADGESVRDATLPLHHVALMRGTKLVIRYYAAPPPPDGIQYAGVFLADSEVDQVYAASEPPAHDDWVRERLPDHQHRRFINVTFKQISAQVSEFIAPLAGDDVASGDAADLGRLSDQLGSLLVDVEGDGAGSNREAHTGAGGGGSAGRRGTRIQVLPPDRIAKGDGVELRVPVKILTSTSRGSRVALTARALVMVAGGAEREPPSGAAVPQVIGWQVDRDTPLMRKATIAVDVDRERECILTVFQPSDCFVRVVVDVD